MSTRLRRQTGNRTDGFEGRRRRSPRMIEEKDRTDPNERMEHRRRERQGHRRVQRRLQLDYNDSYHQHLLNHSNRLRKKEERNERSARKWTRAAICKRSEELRCLRTCQKAFPQVIHSEVCRHESLMALAGR
jgi:hypothetical protein